MATPIKIKRSAVKGKRPGLSDLQLGELALNTNDGNIFVERDTGGVGIATTIANVTPWTENYGGESIYYNDKVGIGTTDPQGTLQIGAGVTVYGSTGIVSATKFKGNLYGNATSATSASNLTGTPDINVSNIVGTSLNISGTTGTLKVGTGITASGGIITATKFVKYPAATGFLKASGEVDNASYIEVEEATLDLILSYGNSSDRGIDVGISTLGNVSSGFVKLYHDNKLVFQTVGTGVSVSSGTGKTATIFGPEEIHIDPSPIGVGTTSGIVRIKGDLYVDGTEFIVNSETITLGDFVVGIASTVTSDALTDGAGIGIGSIGHEKTFKYEYNSVDPLLSSLKSSENLNVASGKGYQIAETEVLNATTLGSGVLNSSLTSVGTLGSLNVTGISTLGVVTSGTWQGTDIADDYIASATTWNAKQSALTFGLSSGNALKSEEALATNDILLAGTSQIKGRTYAELKSDLSLNNVENTALSTWTGSTKITSVGEVGVGTWQGTDIADDYIASATTWNAKLDNVVEDTTPQLGGNLDGNSKSIDSINNLKVTGITTVGFATATDVWVSGTVTATTFKGDLTGDVTGNADTATSASGLTGTPDINVSNIVGTSLSISGIATVTDTFKVGTGITASAGVITATSFSGSGANLTGLTGASADTYGDASNVAAITVNSDGKITGISEVAISGGGGAAGLWAQTDAGINTSSYVGIGTTNPLADLQVGTGVTVYGNAGIVSATTFKGALEGDVTGNADTATNASGLTGSPDITVGTIVGTALSVSGISTVTDTLKVGTAITAHAGIITATKFVKTSGTSSQFLKADGSVDPSTYLTSYTETSTLDNVLGRGNSSTKGMNVGISTLGNVSNGFVKLYNNSNLVFETVGTGVSVSNAGLNTATIFGPSEIIIDPHPVGVATTSGIVRIKGDLYVDGKNFIIDSETITLGDFVVGIASTVTTEALTDGAGIGIGSAGHEKTFKYYYNSGTNPSLKSSENLNVASGKGYQIDQTEVLNATTLGSAVVNSSLTSVGTLGSLTVTNNITANGNIVGDDSTNISGISSVTATNFYGSLKGNADTATYATDAGISTYATDAGISTYAGTAGIATYATSAGIATDATNLTNGANITTGTISINRLGSSGTADSSTFLRGDNTWATPSGGGGGGGSSLWESNATGINTSTNVGIGTTTASDATLVVDVGTASTAVVVQGSEGQLFSVTNSLSSGSIFSVNDISGIPSIDVDADGTIQLAPYGSTENVGVGTTNPTSKLHVVGDIKITGVATATDFDATSDIRLKTNIKLIDDPLAKVIQIEGVSFNWKEDNKAALGVIADQVQEIIPELVRGDDPKTVNYNGFIGLLIEAVKEQQTQIDNLNERLSKLE